MNLDEPTAALRVIPARLFDNTGNPLPLAHVFSAGDLKLIKPDGSIANASTLPAEIVGAAAGSFSVQVSQAEISTLVGYYRWQLAGAGYTFWEWAELVTVPTDAIAVLTSIIEGVDQVDGGGEAGGQNVTFVQALREILAYASGNATGIDGLNPIYKSRGAGAPSSGARNRIVATLVNGLRTITSRDNT